MRLFAVAVGLAVFVLNPGFGCGEDPFQYGPEQMKRAGEGTWSIFVDGEAAPRATFTLSHRLSPGSHAPWGPVRPAGACGNRSFVPAAAACGSSSEMLFEVSDVTAATPFDLVTTARLRVPGLTFGLGTLDVAFANGMGVEIRVDGEGTIESARLFGPRGVLQPQTLHVQRLPPAP